MSTINVQSGVAAHLSTVTRHRPSGRSRRSAPRAATPSTSSRRSSRRCAAGWDQSAAVADRRRGRCGEFVASARRTASPSTPRSTAMSRRSGRRSVGRLPGRSRGPHQRPPACRSGARAQVAIYVAARAVSPSASATTEAAGPLHRGDHRRVSGGFGLLGMRERGRGDGRNARCHGHGRRVASRSSPTGENGRDPRRGRRRSGARAHRVRRPARRRGRHRGRRARRAPAPRPSPSPSPAAPTSC